ncbi:mitogen-activated protein kinase, putative,protein kinase [Trypanosoma rangeli]|uniref:Mitogen-activated protein kinase n=1 Tax=Trypanosoma rangeli TaxID=5698 RepID=A0A3R7M0A0_TRYRA|nr:mitogen-activated protein kinase, putative,protein kinase [Trypanosoma rangeli]RNF06725.1 mitogen-activated protein kinase, putative,protein kinase [Trypanosoma rangeli]|eukprot:RNF06725.1 mitogen-activated protein kinase, putative,protein kinase [Trypanosoma rangeli]
MLTHVSAPDAEGRVTYTFNSQSKVEVPQRYEVKGIVGRGAYGIVCSAVDRRTGDAVAIKKMSNIFGDVVDGKRILREVKLLGFLRHPNVLSLKNLYRPSGPDFSDLYMVSELMSSDLHTILRSNSVRLAEVHCQYFTYQVLCALHYIHSANVIHRDLKPANILTNCECDVKLCDFGLARGRGLRMTHYVVTRWYRPPELMLMSDDYDGAIDLWGVACLAVEMFTRHPLFPGRDYIHQLNLITDLLGLPDIARDMTYVRSEEALNYLRSLPPRSRQPLESVCPQLKDSYMASISYNVEEGDGGDSAAREVEKEGVEETVRKEEMGSVNANTRITSPNPASSGEERYALFKDFLFKLLTYNPKERMTAKEALRHPWLREVRDNCGGEEFETEAGMQFVWDLDSVEVAAAQLRQLLMDEIAKYKD